MHQHAFAYAVRHLHQCAGMVRNETGAVEGNTVLLAIFATDPVARDQRHHVGGSMALHGARPVVLAVERRVLWLTADGRGVQQ